MKNHRRARETRTAILLDDFLSTSEIENGIRGMSCNRRGAFIHTYRLTHTRARATFREVSALASHPVDTRAGLRKNEFIVWEFLDRGGMRSVDEGEGKGSAFLKRTIASSGEKA